MTELEALLALNMLPKIGPVKVRRLLDAFGTPSAILTASSSALQKVQGVGPELAGILTRWEDHTDLSAELERIREAGIDIIPCTDPDYPENLRQIHDPPLLLYVWGKVEARDKMAIAVVGSRRTTSYGLSSAKKLSFQLANAGVTVISGLARGIDTAAHEGALAAKGRTIAVIGSGLSRLYPPENMPLAERIAAGHGAVISEFPMLTEPDKQTFPQRNRIVSGWSQGVLVIEAPAWSGAIITANNAADQGRNVYAVPGPIDRASSLGCNKLIQGGARLVLDASDILDDLNVLLPASMEEPANPAPAPARLTTPEENAVWAAIGNDETHADQIIAASGLSASIVSSTLMRLELKRVVRQMPGRFYVKLL